MSLLFLNVFTFFQVCFCVSVCAHECRWWWRAEDTESITLSYSYRQLWVTWHGCWKSNMDFLYEWQEPLTAGPSPKPSIYYFSWFILFHLNYIILCILMMLLRDWIQYIFYIWMSSVTRILHISKNPVLFLWVDTCNFLALLKPYY